MVNPLPKGISRMADKGTVFITGASTGIGYTCALRLDRLGYKVIASVRKDEDGNALRDEASDRLKTVLCDVTDRASIHEAVAEVSRHCGEAGLAGLINNAGIAVPGPIEFLPEERLRTQFEINVFGLVFVTQGCIPLLRAGKGRLINMGSIGGRCATPYVGAYAASKFAVEALTDALRLELKPWGIEVVVLEPGAIATPIWAKGRVQAEDSGGEAQVAMVELYGGPMRAMRTYVKRTIDTATPPEAVADAVVHALTAARPKPRYVIGRDAKVRLWLERLPTGLRDRLMLSRLRE
jgi:NAD(P)-dependent dehydrogenase (short-subunit alcohol dehydrogenase family)